MSKLLAFPAALALLLPCSGFARGAGYGLQARSQADNVVVLLDASGSMSKPMIGSPSQAKMDAAKAAIRVVLQRVPPTTQVGLLVFSGKNKRDDWVHPLGERDDRRMIADLDALRPDGGTPLGRYMKVAADRLLEQRREQNGYGSYRLLVVTDGQADDDDQPLVDRHLPDILSRGIVVDVIGVSMEEDHVLATRVHSYRRADDAQSLQTALSEVFAEVSGRGDAGTTFEEGRELLAALPSGLALPVLSALATQDDEPIGSRPRERGSSQEASGPSGGSSSGGGSSGSGAVGRAVIFAVVFVVLLMIARRRRRRRSS